MTAAKPKPPGFNEFLRHPFPYIAFVAITAMGAMYWQGEKEHKLAIEALQHRVTEVEDKYDALNILFIETVTKMKKAEE